jgi:hypothetical protein
MKFCPVVPEICRGQVHGPQKERRKRKRIIIIIIRNGAKTISLQTLLGRLNKYIVVIRACFGKEIFQQSLRSPDFHNSTTKIIYFYQINR